MQRVLTHEEIPQIIPLVEAYVRESQLPIVFRPEKVQAFWAGRYQADSGALRGYFESGTLVGLFGVHRMDSTFGDVLFANEWIWWVEPTWRKGAAGLALLEWAEQWAQARGLGLSVGAYDCVHGAVMARFYHRRGYCRRGSVFTKQWEGTHV